MKKLIAFLFIIVFLIACNKNESVQTNEDLIKSTKWLTVSEAKNGIDDPSGANKQSTLDFRNDGKMYFKQVFPFFLDTVKYEFVDNNNIRITKPWATYTVNINYAINLLNSTHFDFRLTSTLNTDVYEYKTIRQ
jgi:hypothetical protein